MIEPAVKLADMPPVDKNDCWIWAMGHFPKGYGRLWVGKKAFYAHRVSFEIHKRPLLPGEIVCHRCDNPPCINPEHLVAGSHSDNFRDMLRKGRGNKATGDRHWVRKHPQLVGRGPKGFIALDRS